MKYLVNIIHILFSGPLLIYVGYVKPEYNFVYYILIALGVILLLHLGYHIFEHISKKTFSNSTIWYMIHVLLFAPLLLWCGIMKTKTPHMIFAILMAIGCAAFGYHILRLISKVMK